MGFIYDWWEERLEIQCIADDILAKFVPAHVNIFYCFVGACVSVQCYSSFKTAVMVQIQALNNLIKYYYASF